MIFTVTLNPAIDYHINVVDDVEVGKSQTAEQESYYAGGKGINVSRVLKNLEIPTRAYALLGGSTGEFIRKNTEDIVYDIPIKDATRINTKLKSNGKETEIRGVSPMVTEEELMSLRRAIQSKCGYFLVLSGSIPRGVPTDIYKKIIQSSLTPRIILDTSGEMLKEAIQCPNIFLLKPNLDELSEFYGVTIDTTEKALEYAQKMYTTYDIKYLIVSLGKDGAYLLCEDSIYFSAGIKGELISSVGAGDSMIGGFLANFLRTENVIEAFKYSMACGAGTSFSDGLVTKEIADELVKKVIVEKIK